jgi:endogenous inhibitor of DNA gyrase (YacG/DUF329 family)
MPTDRPQSLAQDCQADASSPQRIVRCPACGGDSVYAASNLSRPFCSERCKGMDLGAWASESFRVAATASPDDETWEPSDLH